MTIDEEVMNDHYTLLTYVQHNNVREIKKLLRKAPDLLNETYLEYSRPILHYACSDLPNVRKETIETLLAFNRADLNRRIGHKSLLHYAAFGKKWNILKLVAGEDGVDINATTEGKTALHLLVKCGEIRDVENLVKCVNVLLEKKLAISWRDYERKTALTYAEERKLTPIVELLKRSTDEPDDDDYKTGYDFLIDREEDEFINWYDGRGEFLEQHEKSYLQLACQFNLIKVSNKLIEIDPNRVGAGNETHPLMIAVRFGHVQIVQRFMEKLNALTLAPDVSTLLLEAVKRVNWGSDYKECCLLLLELKNAVNVNQRDDATGASPPHLATKYGAEAVVKELLRHKASINNSDRWNRLSIADINHNILTEAFDTWVTLERGKQSNYVVHFDYAVLHPTDSKASATRLLVHIANDENQRPLLKHPLIQSFLWLKWHRMLILFLINIVFNVVYAGIVTCYFNSKHNRAELQTGKIGISNIISHLSTLIRAIGEILTSNLLLFCVCILTIIKCSQIIMEAITQYKMMGWKSIYIDSVLSKSTFTCQSCQILAVLLLCFDIWPETSYGIAMLFIAIELVFLFECFPYYAACIIMLCANSRNVLKLCPVILILIPAFTTNFAIFFPKFTEEHWWISAFRTTLMLSGEYNSGDSDFGMHSIASRFVFLAYVFFVVTIVYNLLTSLAVNGTNDETVELIKLENRVRSVAFVENMIKHCCKFPKLEKLLIIKPENMSITNERCIRMKLELDHNAIGIHWIITWFFKSELHEIVKNSVDINHKQ